jgi:large conductance mechanosensitive channel
MLREFRQFIARGNVLDLAVAVIIGVAFGRVVTALVEGVLMPPIGMALGGVDFSSLFVVLDRSQGIVPISLAQAKAAGIPVIAYGQFINEIISFLIVALAVFLIVRQVTRLRRQEPPAPTTMPCPLCLSSIPVAAKRCASCCADLGTVRP